MAAFDSSLLGYYLLGVLTLAAIALAFAVGVVAEAATRNHRIRVSRHQSVRSYYGRLALHH